jgi:hypothetical protein
MVLQARQFYLCCVPLRRWYSACRHELRSRAAAKAFHLNLAKGSGLISVAQVLQTCRDASVCQRMGILLQELSSDKRLVKLDTDSAEVLVQDNGIPVNCKLGAHSSRSRDRISQRIVVGSSSEERLGTSGLSIIEYTNNNYLVGLLEVKEIILGIKSNRNGSRLLLDPSIQRNDKQKAESKD